MPERRRVPGPMAPSSRSPERRYVQARSEQAHEAAASPGHPACGRR